MLKNASAMTAECEALRLGIEYLTVLCASLVSVQTGRSFCALPSSVRSLRRGHVVYYMDKAWLRRKDRAPHRGFHLLCYEYSTARLRRSSLNGSTGADHRRAHSRDSGGKCRGGPFDSTTALFRTQH